MRITFAVSCWLTILVLVFVVTIMFEMETINSLYLSFGIWVVIMYFSVEPFLVSVPEVAGLVTINLLQAIDGKQYYCYKSGMHFRFPWEQVKEGNYINLRLVTDGKKETYPSLNGPIMIVEWSFQYRPLVPSLDRYIAVDETTINKGLVDVGSSFLSSAITKRDADKCKTEQSEIEEQLRGKFEAKSPNNDKMRLVEEMYGIEVIRVSLSDLDYSEKYQRARETKTVSEKLKETAVELQSGRKISDKDALNAVMIMNGDISKNVQEVEGEGGQALAALLMSMANAKGGR